MEFTQTTYKHYKTIVSKYEHNNVYAEIKADITAQNSEYQDLLLDKYITTQTPLSTEEKLRCTGMANRSWSTDVTHVV